MDRTAANIRSMVPYVRQGVTGWLAASVPGSELRIGVIAGSEAAARDAFAEASEAWARLHERPEGTGRAAT